jgi:hypothetical protein
VKRDLLPPPTASVDTPPPPLAPPSTPSADDRGTAFRPVEGGGELQSGEKLLVEAYAAIWLILFALVLLSWRKQGRLGERMNILEGAIERARKAGAKGDP